MGGNVHADPPSETPEHAKLSEKDPSGKRWWSGMCAGFVGASTLKRRHGGGG